jgi:hypothetical protein
MNISHSVRRSVLEQEITWTVTDTALERSEQGGVTSYALTDVRAIRIAYDPTRIDKARHWCEVTLRSGLALRIVSTHFRGLADFEDRGRSYTAMVRALIGAIAKINAACTFEAGQRRIRYIGELIFLGSAVMFLLAVLLFSAGLGVSEIVVIKLILIAAMLPTLRNYLRKNWPRPFTAAAIPDDALPSDS